MKPVQLQRLFENLILPKNPYPGSIELMPGINITNDPKASRPNG